MMRYKFELKDTMPGKVLGDLEVFEIAQQLTLHGYCLLKRKDDGAVVVDPSSYTIINKKGKEDS